MREIENDDGSIDLVPYLVLNGNVKISVGKWNNDKKAVENFEEVDLGQYRTVKCTDPYAGLDALLEGDHINEDEHADRVEFIKDKNIRFNLAVPPVEG